MAGGAVKERPAFYLSGGATAPRMGGEKTASEEACRGAGGLAARSARRGRGGQARLRYNVVLKREQRSSTCETHGGRTTMRFTENDISVLPIEPWGVRVEYDMDVHYDKGIVKVTLNTELPPDKFALLLVRVKDRMFGYHFTKNQEVISKNIQFFRTSKLGKANKDYVPAEGKIELEDGTPKTLSVEILPNKKRKEWRNFSVMLQFEGDEEETQFTIWIPPYNEPPLPKKSFPTREGFYPTGFASN